METAGEFWAGTGQKTLAAVWGIVYRGHKSGSRKTSSKATAGEAYVLNKGGSNGVGEK